MGEGPPGTALLVVVLMRQAAARLAGQGAYGTCSDMPFIMHATTKCAPAELATLPTAVASTVGIMQCHYVLLLLTAHRHIVLQSTSQC